MTEEDKYKKLKKKTKAVLHNTPWREEAEDICHDIFIKKKDTQRFEHALIDWFRKNGPRSKKGFSRFCFRTHSAEIDEEKNEDKKTQNDSLVFEFYIKELPTEDRIISILRWVWDFSEQEIGYCFGISGEAISNRLQAIYKSIRKNILKKKLNKKK